MRDPSPPVATTGGAVDVDEAGGGADSADSADGEEGVKAQELSASEMSTKHPPIRLVRDLILGRIPNFLFR